MQCPLSHLILKCFQGNHYCSREGNNGGSGYHYSNTYVSNICALFMLLVLVVVMEVTTTKTPMVLHTTTVEMGIRNTLLPTKPPRSRHNEW